MMSADLFQAIEQHDVARVVALLARGADPNALRPAPPHWRPLHSAINELEEGGDLNVVLTLLKHGADVNGWDAAHDVTPLLLAIFNGQPQVVATLLRAGADPNVRNSEGDSPLLASVRHGERHTVAMLIHAGVTKTINEYGGLHGYTALGMAAKRLDIPVIQLLLDAGANPEARDEDSKTARERLPSPSAENEPAQHTAEALLRSA